LVSYKILFLETQTKDLMVDQRLAASTWWCGPLPSREMGRNGETTSPRDRPSGRP